jgi:hypothetical protein
MKVTEEQLAEMEADGAVVKRNPTNRPQEVEPDPEPVVEEKDDDEHERVEAEAMRTLVAQNSEVMSQIGKALEGMKPREDTLRGADFEMIRSEEALAGGYKPLTHIRMRMVRGKA